jgi:hypothetical protein
MTQTMKQILKQATFYSDGQGYAFVKLPATAITAAAGLLASIAEPFCALVVDKDEVSLMIPAEAWVDFGKRFVDAELSVQSYRLITMDVILQPDLVGFMAFLSEALAHEGVSILPFAAYSRDHIFVQANQFELALAALETLRSS